MDTPETAPSELNTDSAAAEFSALLSPEPEKKPAEATTDEPAVEAQAEPVEEPAAPEENAAEEGADAVTVEIDGKPVVLTKEQIADAYKSGLRQEDYTRKTMELAENRKAAEAETAKARDERNQYAANLQRNAVMLEGALQEQQKTDWQALLNSDPMEYLKQQHLFQERQAALQQTNYQRQQLEMTARAEQAEQMKSYVQSQQAELLAKIPEWKDESKAKVQAAELREYLKNQGYDEQTVNNVADHKAVIMARKAMLYDQMIAKASVAAKKVSALPNKVERPGSGSTPSTDKRSADYQRFAKSGRVEDAAAVFASLI